MQCEQLTDPKATKLLASTERSKTKYTTHIQYTARFAPQGSRCNMNSIISIKKVGLRTIPSERAFFWRKNVNCESKFKILIHLACRVELRF